MFFLRFFTGKNRDRVKAWMDFRLHSTSWGLCRQISSDHCQAGLKPVVPRQPQIYFWALLRAPCSKLLKYRNQQQPCNHNLCEIIWKWLSQRFNKPVLKEMTKSFSYFYYWTEFGRLQLLIMVWVLLAPFQGMHYLIVALGSTHSTLAFAVTNSSIPPWSSQFHSHRPQSDRQKKWPLAL